MFVYAQIGNVSVDGKFEEKTWLAFYYSRTIDTDKRKLLGSVEADFPIVYPLKLDNGIIINESDYYRETEIIE